MMTIEDVNAMSAAQFVAAFGDVAEHSIWVAECAAKGALRHAGAFYSFSALHEAFITAVLTAPEAQQLSILRAHPDLATRAKLTADSTTEQKGAGLDNLSAEEFARFTALNNQYKEQNGFPFIFAVKGATKHQILESFETRIHHSREEEFQVALKQVCKIIGFRLEVRVKS
jgi:2-oxo-4-hydroxy-4-carboxy-5-ureidoimidazoline decarboxylase